MSAQTDLLMLAFRVGDRVEVSSRFKPSGTVVDKRHHFVWVQLDSGRTIPVVPMDLRHAVSEGGK